MINNVLCLFVDSKLYESHSAKQGILTKAEFDGVKWAFTGVNSLLLLPINLYRACP